MCVFILLLLPCEVPFDYVGTPSPPAIPKPSSKPLPPCRVEDAKRFPDLNTCRAVCAHLDAQLRWVNAHLEMCDPWEREFWQGYREVLEQSRGPWRHLWNVQVPPVGPLYDLEELRRVLGEDMYARGAMPKVPAGKWVPRLDAPPDWP